MSDLFEGDDEVREMVCDHAGHDWVGEDGHGHGPVEICVQCGALRTVAQSEERTR